jgi:hypothetical protein
MDQGRRLEGVPGAFLLHVLLGDGPQVGVHEREQLIGRAGVAFGGFMEDARQVIG